MRPSPIAAFLLAALLIATLVSPSHLVSPAKAQDCDAAASQTDLNACAGRAFGKADAALNATYRSILKTLAGDAERRKLLVDAQKEWVKLRDLDCGFAASRVAGGSAYPLIVLTCREASTLQRIKTLQSWSTCTEGDLSCPVPR